MGIRKKKKISTTYAYSVISLICFSQCILRNVFEPLSVALDAYGIQLCFLDGWSKYVMGKIMYCFKNGLYSCMHLDANFN